MTAEERIELLEATVADLTIKNAQMAARLRVVDLMEAQAANRLGFQIPVRLVDDVSEEQFSMLVREGSVQQ